MSRIQSEVAQWPGAEIVGVEIGRKHRKLTLRYGTRERFVTLPGTPSDQRAELNQVRDVRKVLAELGAVRTERRKATVKRQRNKPDRNPLGRVGLAPMKPNPWDALQAVTFDPPQPQPTVRSSVWRRLFQFARRFHR